MTQAPASQRSLLREGDTIAQYRLLTRLGEGGMGVVFKAEDRKLRRTVALKLLHPRVAEIPDKRRRFLREGRLAAHLTHPCIATVYEVSEADGRIFIAMELCEGRGLKSLLPDYRTLPYHEALRVIREIARGLRKAHEVGIIHRDLKPDNIMIEDDGIVKILDFGIAKPTESFEVLVTDIHTQHGSLIGTPAYMSPEQATGKAVDARSDIFSLGVLLYELLTTQRPFEGETWQDMIIAINRDAAKPASSLRPDLPPEIDRLLERCMAKAPKNRYESCRELIDDIDRLLSDAGVGRVAMPTLDTVPFPGGASITADTEDPLATGTRRKRSSQTALLLGGAALAAMIAAGAILALTRGESEQGATSAASSAIAPVTATATATATTTETATATATTTETATATATETATETATATATATSAPVEATPTPTIPRPPPPPPSASASARPKNPILGF